MMLRLSTGLLSLILLWGCARAGGYDVSMTYSNLSDSYIYPYRILLNGEAGIPVQLAGCSNGEGSGGIAMTTTRSRPRFVVVEWEHLLSRKAYRARIDLGDEAGEWWRESPFRKADGMRYDRPATLVIQWRGGKKVVAMLSAVSFDFTKGRLELGEAAGVEIPRPEGGVRLYLTYQDLRQKPGGRYWSGTIYRYDRTQDGKLTPEQRFGCPRLADGRVDVSKLPPEKLPLLIGKDGEFIPCREYFCADKAELIERIRANGWKQYPPDKMPPAAEFRDAPNPRPAW